MAPRRKRRRLSLEGAEAITGTTDAEPAPYAPPTASKDLNRRQLFVRGLAPTVTTEALTEYFSESYPIKNALVVLDKESRESKGYGFVTFADAEDAQTAKASLDGTDLQGKKIRIDIAEARQREGDGDVVKASARIKAERDQQIRDAQTPKLIVRNLPWSIKTPEDLQRLFMSYGKVNFVNLPMKPSGELKGFGFVSLRGKKNAEKALQQLNGKEIDGRPVAVDWAVDRDTWQRLQKPGLESELNGNIEDEEDEDATEDTESSIVSSSNESEDDSDGKDEDQDTVDDSDSNTDYADASDDREDDGGVKLDDQPKREEHTVFIRNLPFSIDDDLLKEHFQQFGVIRFARVVVDRETERPKGTGFVCFFNEADMITCLKGVPRVKLQQRNLDKKDGSTVSVTHSVLEDENADPTGKYTIDGRILQLSRAVDKKEATRLTAEGAASRFNRDKDKRRLYLLSEGTIASNSPLFQYLSPSEVKMRQESATLRRKQIQENPSLHLSLTRLSVRNIPRSITSKDLKQLARSAIVGFAADVKSGKRSKLSREEVIRGGQEMVVAEKMRKKKGKGIVKQAKVVFETAAGSKITEDTGAGRSRGYGFIEYYTHRNALMGLRWLNGHAVDYKVKGDAPKSKKKAKEALEDKKKRLIVEFAIENANVVSRRSNREEKTRDPPKPKANGASETISDEPSQTTPQSKKRKRESAGALESETSEKKGRKRKNNMQASAVANNPATPDTKDKNEDKLAQRTRIIAKKRQARKAKRNVGG